jgi:hypothetical protein
MDDLYIKIQLLGELREALRIKDSNLKLFQTLAEILETFVVYRQEPILSHEMQIDHLMDKAFGIVSELGKASPEFQQWLKSPRRFNKIRFCAITSCFPSLSGFGLISALFQ